MAGGSAAGGGFAGGLAGGLAGGSSGGQAGGCTCMPPPNATAVCGDAGCDFECLLGFHRCGAACAPDDSVVACGPACVACPELGGTAVCASGVCGVRCGPQQARCTGQCVPETDQQCGETCAACPPGVRCQSGACRVQCPPGQSVVGSTCTSAREIEAGLFHTCVRHDGGVVCFGGLASTGSLGSGSTDGGRLPQFALGLADVVSLSLSDNSSCAVLGTGAVRCWGENSLGQVGNGATMNAFSPASTIAGGVVSLTSGSNHHCALLHDAGIVCWGMGSSGQLGLGSTPLAVRAPGAMPHDAGATAVFAGDGVTYVRRGDGTLRWTGSDRDLFSSTLVATVLTDGGVRQLVVGANHGCLIRLDSGGLECWGRGLEGQLGYPVAVTAEQPVRTVPGLGPVVDVCAGRNFTCALTPDAGVRCFGTNGAGQLGSGNFVSTSTPTPTDLLPPARQLACHHDHACATTDNGTWCWGDNSQGQLGAPTPVSSPSPLRVSFP